MLCPRRNILLAGGVAAGNNNVPLNHMLSPTVKENFIFFTTLFSSFFLIPSIGYDNTFIINSMAENGEHGNSACHTNVW